MAEKLGVTRNAVIGKAHRLELSRKRSANGHAKPKPSGWHRKKPVIAMIARPPLEPPPEPAPEGGVLLVDLERHHCRWLISEPSEMLFCGAGKEPGFSYCLLHVKLAYQRSGR
jgi:GcrA cell cycle regulator